MSDYGMKVSAVKQDVKNPTSKFVFNSSLKTVQVLKTGTFTLSGSVAEGATQDILISSHKLGFKPMFLAYNISGIYPIGSVHRITHDSVLWGNYLLGLAAYLRLYVNGQELRAKIVWAGTAGDGTHNYNFSLKYYIYDVDLEKNMTLDIPKNEQSLVSEGDVDKIGFKISNSVDVKNASIDQLSYSSFLDNVFLYKVDKEIAPNNSGDYDHIYETVIAHELNYYPLTYGFWEDFNDLGNIYAIPDRNADFFPMFVVGITLSGIVITINGRTVVAGHEGQESSYYPIKYYVVILGNNIGSQ